MTGGDRIVVDAAARRVPDMGEPFVLWDGDGLVVKRLEKARDPGPPCCSARTVDADRHGKSLNLRLPRGVKLGRRATSMHRKAAKGAIVRKPQSIRSRYASHGLDSTAPRMVHMFGDTARQSRRCSVLSLGERSRAGARMASRVVGGRPKIDRSGFDEDRVRVAVRSAPVQTAHRPQRIVRGTQQAEGWAERQGVLHRVGRDNAASAWLHQEEPDDAREGAEAGGAPKEGV